MGERVSILDKVLKDICIRYFYLVIIAFLIFSIYYWVENLVPFKYITSSYVAIHLIFFFIPYKLEFRSIKLLIPIYLVFISMGLFPLVVLYWTIGQVTVFMWYLLIPLASLIFFPIRKVVYWTVFVSIILCVAFTVSFYMPQEFYFPVSERQSAILNGMTITCCIGFVAYFLYYMNKVNQIRMEEYKEMGTVVVHEDSDEAIKRYNELYIAIKNYFEKEKPYCDSEFTITQLAEKVNSNITYISKAIKLNEDVNFSVFVNTYRINQIKEMLDKGYQNTFTIKYIYTSAGFKQQTTFNKVFKQIEGITPTDYIKNHSKP